MERPEGELRALLNRMPAMIGYWDRDLRNRLANDAYLEFFGKGPDEMRGLHISELLGPALYEQNLPYIRRALAGEEQLFDREIPLPSGERRYTQASYVPDISEGEVRGFYVLVTDISRRRRAEVALAGAERRFRTLFESAPIGSLIVEPTGRIRDLNPAAETVLGRPRAALLGASVLDITHHEDRAASVARLARLARAEIPSFRAQQRFVEPRGRTVWAQVDATVLRAGDDPLLLEQIQDVSERRLHEDRLAQFRALLESAPDAIVIIAADTRIRFANAQARAIFGYARNQLVGQPVDVLIPARLRRRHAAHVAAFLADPHLRPMGADLELRGRRRDGTEFPVEVSLSPLETERGVLVSVAIRDVSERDAAERTAQQLAAIVESSDRAIVALAISGEILTWNAAAERIYGYSAAEAAGEGAAMLLQAEDRAGFQERLERVRRGESVEPFESVQVTSSGRTIEVEVEIAPIRGRGHAVVGASMIARDITVAKREQREFERKLIESQKLEALGVLAGGVAHDFNNLLGVILGNTSLALAALPPGSPLEPTLAQVDQAARRSAELANQMLAYSGKGRFVIQPMALSELVRGIAELIQGTVSKKVALTTSFAADTPTIEGDLTQLRQVVLNLITNASEAIGDDNGTIAITTGSVDADASYLAAFDHPEQLATGRYAYLEVADSGPGMSAETRARIFEPFFTTKFTGRGLGLAAVQGIVRSHGGAIKIYSARGRGTSFKLLFPAAATDAPPVPQAAPHGPAWRADGTVLVADDNDGLRHMARVMLESLGFAVVEARDGLEALAALREEDGRLAFALIDVMMPGMTGDEVAREAGRLALGTPIVLSSGYNAQQVLPDVTAGGVSAFLQKPYEFAQLRAVARRVTG